MTIVAWTVQVLLFGQVELDKPVILTGPQDARKVVGLAAPLEESAAVNVEVLSSGVIHWAQASWIGDTLELVIEPPINTVQEGTLLRFSPSVPNSGRSWIQLPGALSAELHRHDGVALGNGDLGMDRVAEIIFLNGKWYLMNATRDKCPTGTLGFKADACIDVDSAPGLRFYEAVDRCAARGGKLCVWDEYAAACVLLEGQLTGLFDAWEWIDDSSNHTHTANQVGRNTCQSQRSINVITTFTGDTRCCFHLR